MSKTKSAAPAARQSWSGQWGFIISAIGSAVGLGNIWRFPGVAYENGGGAFLVPYLIALITAGIPILFLDYALGHRLRGSAPLAFRRLRRWAESLGWFQVMICVSIALYYAAILAWAASFFVFSFNLKWGHDPSAFMFGSFLHMSPTACAPDALDCGFSLTPVWGVMIPLAIVWAATIVILALRLTKGLERANIVFMPLLLVAFGALVVRSVFLPGAANGLNALFTPDFSKLGDPQVWIAAYSQIFFSLSIAFGIMITYSSYRRRRSNQTTPGLVVGLANSSFEILAGIGVFAVLGFMAHEQGQTMDQFTEANGTRGVVLSFVTFPKVISEMPQAWIFGALFFGSLLMAGFTSMLSIVEVVSSALQDKFGLTRVQAALGLGIPMALVSLLLFGTRSALDILDTLDLYTNEIGIVVSAVAMTVVTLWVLRKGKELSYHLSALSTFKVGRIWRFTVSVLAPLVLAYMVASRIDSLLADGYGGYPTWVLLVFGWGAVVVMVAGAFVFKALPWHYNPDDFEAWPPYPPATGAPPASTKGGVA